MSDAFDAVDLFAGPGGWDEGASQIGHANVLGLDNDQAACETAEAAGHKRLKADIAATDPRDYMGVPGLIGSPPCPGFSAAGKGLGRQDFELLLGAIDMIGLGYPVDMVVDSVVAQQHDSRSALTLEPLRWAVAIEPEWIALEQVKEVLPLWQAYVPVLEAIGYSVWAGFLHAEQYGVPQTRKRAVLMASRSGEAAPPVPTHSKYYPHSPERLDEGVEKWVSMAEALNWGPEPVELLSRRDAPAWVEKHGPRPNRVATQPAPTFTGEAHRWAWHRPSTTIVGSFKPEIVAAPGYRTTISRQDAPGSVRVTVQEAGVLQSFRPDYPWQGKHGKQFQQVGNAVPPLLAAHVLAALTGTEMAVAA